MTFPTIDTSLTKQEVIHRVQSHLELQGFEVQEIDATRPWGAFLRVTNAQADKFIDTFFAGVEIPTNARRGERSPKFLLVAPHSRLSWQYHDRRAEYWRAVSGTVGVAVSPTDAQPDEFITLHPGETIELAQGTRHRLIGLKEWGAVAEIWIHIDAHNPSNEEDIYRLQDDFKRAK